MITGLIINLNTELDPPYHNLISHDLIHFVRNVITGLSYLVLQKIENLGERCARGHINSDSSNHDNFVKKYYLNYILPLMMSIAGLIINFTIKLPPGANMIITALFDLGSVQSFLALEEIVSETERQVI